MSFSIIHVYESHYLGSSRYCTCVRGGNRRGGERGRRGDWWEYAPERDYFSPCYACKRIDNTQVLTHPSHPPPSPLIPPHTGVIHFVSSCYARKFDYTHVVYLMCFWVVYLYVGVMTHSYVCQDSITRGTWLIHTNTCRLSDVSVGRVSCICMWGSWHTHMCAMTHLHVGHDSFIRTHVPHLMCVVIS